MPGCNNGSGERVRGQGGGSEEDACTRTLTHPARPQTNLPTGRHVGQPGQQQCAPLLPVPCSPSDGGPEMWHGGRRLTARGPALLPLQRLTVPVEGEGGGECRRRGGWRCREAGQHRRQPVSGAGRRRRWSVERSPAPRVSCGAIPAGHRGPHCSAGERKHAADVLAADAPAAPPNRGRIPRLCSRSPRAIERRAPCGSHSGCRGPTAG